MPTPAARPRQQIPTPTRERLLARSRHRRWRQRQRANQDVISMTVSRSLIETLIELEWLSAAEADDKRKVGAAVAAVLEDLTEFLRHRKRRLPHDPSPWRILRP